MPATGRRAKNVGSRDELDQKNNGSLANGKEDKREDHATAELEANSNRQSQKAETHMVWSLREWMETDYHSKSSPLLHPRKQKQRTAKEKVD